MLKKYIILFLFVYSQIFYSQNETKKWFFGNMAALDFMNNPPTVINSSSLFAYEGCASMADDSGNLLFYTDGMTVWASDNSIMQNGTGLFGNNTCTQSSIILKKPGTSSLYYLFTQGGHGIGNLAYSIIDMNLAAGMGSVTVKNATLAANMAEKLAATRHCNGTDYWVLSHKMNSNDFYVYLLNNSGVSNTPIITSIGSVSTLTTTISGLGYAKFSPNGKKLFVAFNHPDNKFELFDFNPSNGIVSNSLSLGQFSSPYGCEFSPDGSKLYATSAVNYTAPNLYQVIQWDLCAQSPSLIVQSKVVLGIDSNHTRGALQLASDGRIFSTFHNESSLNVIQNPNLSGTSCGYSIAAISLGSTSCLIGLPNFSSHYFREKPVFSSSVNCQTGSFSIPLFCSGTGYNVISHFWSFGDPSSGTANTSSLSMPSHTFASNGNYNVQLILTFDCYSDTLKQVVSVNIPNITTSGKTTICSKEKTTLTASGANTYSWNTGMNTASISVSPSATTIYTVIGTNSTNLCTGTKVVTVTVVPCTGIFEDSETELLINIYPNPNKGEFTIACLNKNTQITIYDHIGKQVYATLINQTQKIDLKELANGIYFVKAEQGGKVDFSKLILSN